MAECPLPFTWFCSYLALCPPIPPGRFPFSALFTLGYLGIPWRVVPPSTRRSHYHPSAGFPCSPLRPLQHDLGGGFLKHPPAHGSSQLGCRVKSRLTCPSVLKMRLHGPAQSLGTIRLFPRSSRHPIRCGRVGVPFPIGRFPLRLDSPYHV